MSLYNSISFITSFQITPPRKKKVALENGIKKDELLRSNLSEDVDVSIVSLRIF